MRKKAKGVKYTMRARLAQSTAARLNENFRNLDQGKWTTPREGLAERFAFQEFHGDVRRAVIRLGRFVNGDDVRVVNAPGRTRLILKAQQEVGVIEKFAVQNLERHRTIPHPNLLSEENRTHAALTQAADKTKTARKT
jgi:hypothetical protein